MDDWKPPVRDLMKMSATHSEGAQHIRGQLLALTTAVAALVRSHPDPQSFAQALRRAWMQADGPAQAFPDSRPGQAGIAAVLSVLEASCSVPLNVRPPDQAEPPAP